MLKMTNKSHETAHRKLLQAKSIGTTLLEHINYKDYGLDAPILEVLDAGNLAWLLTDLLDEALNELDSCDILTTEPENA